jgi:hypothetical protein
VPTTFVASPGPAKDQANARSGGYKAVGCQGGASPSFFFHIFLDSSDSAGSSTLDPRGQLFFFFFLREKCGNVDVGTLNGYYRTARDRLAL